MPKKDLLGYPDTPLKEQVRPYEETQSAWDVILEHFGIKEKTMETINLKPYSTERFGSLNFVLATDEEGGCYAYRETSPYFCFKCDTEEEALDTVAKAFEFYKA